MIEQVVERWHRFITGNLSEGLDTLLADDVVFYSPIVYTPQRGESRDDDVSARCGTDASR